MKGFNEWTGIGNLAADPETRYSTNGNAICTFTLACTTGSGDYEHTEWARCVSFGKFAEIFQQYLKKGSPLYVKAQTKTRKWEDKNGDTRYSTEQVIKDFVFLKGNNQTTAPAKAEPAEAKAQAEPDFDDDIPF